MMKKPNKISRLVIFLCLFCLFSTVGYLQEINNDKSTQDQTDKYLFLTKKSELRFKQEEEVKIELVLKNTSNEEIYFIWTSDLDDFFIEVKDERQKSIPLKKEAEIAKQFPKTGGSVAIRLEPNEEYKFFVNLSNLYDFEKGNYTLTASRLIYKKDKKEKSVVKLKPVKILIS